MIIRTTVHIPESTLDIIDAWAQQFDRSRNWIINEILDLAMVDQSATENAISKFNSHLMKAGK